MSTEILLIPAAIAGLALLTIVIVLVLRLLARWVLAEPDDDA